VVGVLDGVTVLDLSSGIPGPLATMLLADHGARVTSIEAPQGDPYEAVSGSRVWKRGKRRAILDLEDPAQRDVFLALAAQADVIVESFALGTTTRLGLDDDTLRRTNPRLIHCSITAYGTDGKHADRPALEMLVAARTGQQWEHRGIVGGTLAKLAGGEGMLPGLEPPDEECWVGPARDGPLASGVPWASMATAYLTTLAISAALRERELSGHGQHIGTSLLQGVLATTIGPWQRTERFANENYQSWLIDPRAPKAIYQAADGRSIHQWVILPTFVLGVSQGDKLEIPPPDDSGPWQVAQPRDTHLRIGIGAENMVILHEFDAKLREAIAKFPSDEWVRIAAEVGVPLQTIRSPEEALLDDLLLADGCVVEVDDADLGPIRQVGSVYRLSACPDDAPAPPAALGAHTAEVTAEAAQEALPTPAPPPRTRQAPPLAGIRVVDLGLAVAGPFGTQLMADLGADVIKVNTLTDDYWFQSHLAIACNRGKRSISLDLKDPDGYAILERLVATADIVQHNVRYDAATRLRVDYDTLKRIRPALIYCHSRGFDHGPRDRLPGNDQTGAALAGTTWLDGAMDNGGKGLWSPCSLGDTGNGFLTAIAMTQALYHRDRTGEGQFIDTSIIYAHLLNTSMSWVTADGKTAADRPKLDGMHFGWGPLYRLYPTSDGWICIAAITGAEWTALCEAAERPALLHDVRFASAAARTANADALAAELEKVFVERSATEWFELLDAAGVPCEISDPNFVMRLFDDPEMREKGWVTTYEHAAVGRMDVFGLLFDFAETPGVVQRPAPVVGEHSREILTELGYAAGAVDDLMDRGVAREPSAPAPGRP
jgi:crotonobetainyl-CoA:carnitine CoA-transferase CaiB-like acyl-CoA transferase